MTETAENNSVRVTLQPQTPSEKIIAKIQAQIKSEVIDETGRLIQLKVPDALDEFDLSAALDTESQNMGCLAMASPLLYVAAIEGTSFPMPQNYEQVRAGIKRLGNSGIKAVMTAVQEYAEQQQLSSQSQQEQIGEVKKS